MLLLFKTNKEIMASVNTSSSHKFVLILNEKSPPGKLVSATGQLAMSLQAKATPEQRDSMCFISMFDPQQTNLIELSTNSFIVLKGKQNQLMTLYAKAVEQKVLAAIFTSTMSYCGIEEDH